MSHIQGDYCAKARNEEFDGVAFQAEAKKHPNFGKAQGMLTEQWWANVRVFLSHFLFSIYSP